MSRKIENYFKSNQKERTSAKSYYVEKPTENNPIQQRDEDIEPEEVRKIIYNCLLRIRLPNLILFISSSF